jgi:hypothetical protein
MKAVFMLGKITTEPVTVKEVYTIGKRFGEPRYRSSNVRTSVIVSSTSATVGTLISTLRRPVPMVMVFAFPELGGHKHTLRLRALRSYCTSAKSNRYMCTPYANLGKPPLEAFAIQLREARAEWRRRHPKT